MTPIHKEGEPAMTNRERFNTMLNSCQRPKAVYNALQALRTEIVALSPAERKELLTMWKAIHTCKN